MKTTEKRGRYTARDGGKKVKDRKRHIVVNSQGLLIGVFVTEANASERLGAVVALNEARDKLSKLEVLWVDQGYSGKNECECSSGSLWRLRSVASAVSREGRSNQENYPKCISSYLRDGLLSGLLVV